MNGLEDIPRVGRILRTPGAHPNLKEEPCGDSRPRLSGGAQLCSLFSAPVRHFQRTSMEDGRPRPSRFEHWRASKFPSRHFKPPRDGGLVRRGERSSATHGIVIPDERVCEVRDLERRAKRPQAHKSARSARIPCQSRLQLSTQTAEADSKARKIRRNHPNH